MQRNHNIDVLKLICAILVVVRHITTPFSDNYIPITSCAVPCFFIISGYMMYKDNGFTVSLKKSIKKIIGIILWSTVFFCMVKLIYGFHDGISLCLTWRDFYNFIVFNQNPFGFHLWYLNAYLYTLLIILLFNKFNLLRILYYLIPLLLLFNLILGKYSDVIVSDKSFGLLMSRNFLFTGIPCFTLGLILKKYSSLLIEQKFIKSISFVGIVLFSCTSLIEEKILSYYGISSMGDLYISTIFLSISLLLFFLSLKNNSSNFFSVLGEKDSLYIYIPPFFIHGMWLYYI